MAKRKLSGDLGWVHPIDESDVKSHPLSRTLAAGEKECKAIAARLQIPAVHSLSATMTLSRVPGNKAVIYVEGVLKSDVTQSCVVTAAPVKAHIEEEFEAWYADPASFTSIAKARNERAAVKGQGPAETEIAVMEEREDPEPIIDGKIDLGDLVAQYLSLSLDPYPRAHDAVWESGGKGDAPEPSELRKNPFAVLKDWKGR